MSYSQDIVDPISGKLYENEGFYLEKWYPMRGNGQISAEEYNLYIAPDDLRDSEGQRLCLTFNEAVARIETLNQWNGHNGAKFGRLNPQEALQESKLKINGDIYNGAWCFPDRDMHEKIKKFLKNNPESLLGKSFVKAADEDPNVNHWSCSRWPSRAYPNHIFSTNFEKESSGYLNTDFEKAYLRLVRLVPVNGY